MISKPVFAFDGGLGLAVAEEGDDQFRPAALLHLGWSPFYYSRVFYYGRTFGPITEQTYLASFSRRFGLFKSSGFEGAVGGCFLSETITMRSTDDSPNTSTTVTKASVDEREQNYNVGMTFGVFWIPSGFAPFYLNVGWESHVFLAGSAGLFLSTGRKQMVSVTTGLKF